MSDPFAQYKEKADPFDQYKEKSSVMITPPAPSKGTVTVEQAQKEFDKSRPDTRSRSQVAADQLSNVGEGAVNLLQHPVDTLISPALQQFKDVFLGGPVGQLKAGTGLIEAGKGLFGVPIRGAAAAIAPDYVKAPTKEEWENHAKNVGANAMGLLLGEGVGEGVKAIAPTTGSILKGIVQKGSDAIDAASEGVKKLRTSPQTLITKGLNPSDPNFQKYVDTGLSELKEAQKTVGPIRDVKTAQKGLNERWNTIDADIEKRVQPYEAHIVPGSAQEMIQRQISAIPDDWKIHNVDKYNRLVEDIRNAHPQDYTIGELNRTRSSLGKANSTFYGKDIAGQLTMEEGPKAVQMARETAARDQFYKGMDQYGQGVPVRELNSRVGAILHLQDELFDNLNKSIAEQRPWRPVPAIKKALGGELKGVDENLAAAVRAYNEPYRQVPMKAGPRPNPLSPPTAVPPPATPVNPVAVPPHPMAAPQSTAPLSNAPPAPLQIGQAPNPVEGTTSPAIQSIYAQRGHPMETTLNVGNRQTELPHQADPLYNKPVTTQEPSSANLPVSGTKTTAGTQTTYQKGLAPDIFGMKQNAGPAVPLGSKLSFKSKLLNGVEQFHYETPDGRLITVDHEIPKSQLKTQTTRPYEPGSAWNSGSPKTQTKTPIKLLTREEWMKKFGKLNPPPEKSK